LLTHVLAVFGLALGCAAWVALQRWMSRHHPEIPGEEKRFGGCRFCDKSGECEEGGVCEERPPAAIRQLPAARVESSRRKRSL
jgi:hypothetical protein